MTSTKRFGMILAFVVLFALLASNASAIWTPMSSAPMVNLGGFNLDSSLGSGSAGDGVYHIGSSIAGGPLGNDSSINSSSNNTSVNSSSMEALPLETLDLSSYAEDRHNKSLSGYTNIMYPLAESSGFTATTSGGGSGGGGCGCGGG